MNKLLSVSIPSFLFVFVVVFILSSLVAGNHEKFTEQYKPIRETVCAGKATKAQLTGLVQCMEQFKASFKDMNAKATEVKNIVQSCLTEGNKDITFEVEKNHMELVYLMCSKKFGECMHRQLPIFQTPAPAATWRGEKGTEPPIAPPPGEPDGGKRVEEFIACEKKVLNLS